MTHPNEKVYRIKEKRSFSTRLPDSSSNSLCQREQERRRVDVSSRPGELL